MKRLAFALAAACALALPARAETVTFGIDAPFSGAVATWWGTQFKQAIELYQREHGAAVNGIAVNVIYRDTGGTDPTRSRQLAQELILRDKARFLGGFVYTPDTLAVAPLITEAKVPAIIFNAGTSAITRKSPYFVRTSVTEAQVATQIARWAAANGTKTAMTLIADYGPGYDAEETFVKEFSKAGGTIVSSARYPLATNDFAPYMERVLQTRPDGLFIFAPGGPVAIGVINAWAQRGLKDAGIKLFATGEAPQIDLPAIGDAAIGMVTAYHYTETYDSPENKKLAQGLIEMFGKDALPNHATVAAYDGIGMVYACLQKLGMACEGDAAMGFFKTYRAVSPRGPISIDPQTRDIVENVYIRRVEKRNATLVNIIIATVPDVKDPWKEQNPE